MKIEKATTAYWDGIADGYDCGYVEALWNIELKIKEFQQKIREIKNDQVQYR